MTAVMVVFMGLATRYTYVGPGVGECSTPNKHTHTAVEGTSADLEFNSTDLTHVQQLDGAVRA